jgi:surfactin synthase thioesterase subunit
VSYLYIDQDRYASGQQLGVVAQELQKQFPELVVEGDDGFLAVNYSQLSAVLLQAVKEQQKEIETLKAQMAAVLKKLGM